MDSSNEHKLSIEIEDTYRKAYKLGYDRGHDIGYNEGYIAGLNYCNEKLANYIKNRDKEV